MPYLRPLPRLRVHAATAALVALLLVVSFLPESTWVMDRPVHPTSVQPLTRPSGETFCTSFSINEATGLWATARHCVSSSEFALAGGYGEVVYRDIYWDMAVVQTAYRAPAIPLAGSSLQMGQAVVMYGYPKGSPVLIRTQGHVAGLLVPIPGAAYSTMFDLTGAGGNSGSPIVRNGSLVAVMWGKSTNSEHVLGVPFDAMVRVLGPFMR